MRPKISNRTLALTVVLLGLTVGTIAQTTGTCPPAPNQVTVKVVSNVTFDPLAKLFTYSYLVSNGLGSAQDIDSFSLDFAPPIANIANPSGWVHGMVFGRSTVGWDAGEAGTLAPGAPDSGEVTPSLVQIKPGQSLGGFSFQSPKSPGPVKYFVSGFVAIPAQADEEAAETLMEQCVGSFGDVIDQSVVGTTQGPVDFIPIAIEIKPPSTPPVSINPNSNGVTPVAVLGTTTFNVSSIVPASLRLGPGGSEHHRRSDFCSPASGKARFRNRGKTAGRRDGSGRAGGRRRADREASRQRRGRPRPVNRQSLLGVSQLRKRRP